MPKAKQRGGYRPIRQQQQQPTHQKGRQQQQQRHSRPQLRVAPQPQPPELPPTRLADRQGERGVKGVVEEDNEGSPIRKYGVELERLLLDSEFFSTGLVKSHQHRHQHQHQHRHQHRHCLVPQAPVLGAALACLPVQLRLPSAVEFLNEEELLRHRRLAKEAVWNYVDLLGLDDDSATALATSIVAAATTEKKANEEEEGEGEKEDSEWVDQFDWLDLLGEEEEEEDDEQEEEHQQQPKDDDNEEGEEEEEVEQQQEEEEPSDPLLCDLELTGQLRPSVKQVEAPASVAAEEKSLEQLEAELFAMLD